MKKLWILAGLFLAWLNAFSQKPDTAYVKKKLSETEIQVLFSFYTQDGNHSAVTGGTGTEKLQVYAPGFTVTKRFDSLNTANLTAGVDVISSASTDKIDFVKSSASLVDSRGYLTFGYQHKFNKPGLSLGGNLGFSLESDYYSTGAGVSLKRSSKTKSTILSLDAQAFFDDLRWGRVNVDYYKPVKLIYPKELRYREWYDTYKRNSYNITFGFYQVLNKKMSLEIYPGFSYQHGLLATPFHRIYFNDHATLRVENLPENRIKIPVGIQLNSFITGGWFLRTYYRFYKDDFGITAHTVNFDSPVKISPLFTITPFVRLYTQTQSEYFKPYMQHDISEAFYTSDYDLSGFNDIKTGMGLRYAPFKKNAKGHSFNEVNLRYAYYLRSDGMQAHMISLVIGYSKERNKDHH